MKGCVNRPSYASVAARTGTRNRDGTGPKYICFLPLTTIASIESGL